MSESTITTAAAAFVTLANTKATNKAENSAAFARVALLTHDAVSAGRGAAAALAAANKEAGVGYGSEAAVGFVALTGEWMHLPMGEDEKARTPEQVRAAIKQAGQKDSKAILRRKGMTAGKAFDLIKAAGAKEFDPAKTMEDAFALLQQVEEWRMAGHQFGDDFDALLAANNFRAALDNIAPEAKAKGVVIVKEKAAVAA